MNSMSPEVIPHSNQPSQLPSWLFDIDDDDHIESIRPLLVELDIDLKFILK